MFANAVPDYVRIAARFAALGIDAVHHHGAAGGFWLMVEAAHGPYGATISLSRGGDVPYHWTETEANALLQQIEGSTRVAPVVPVDADLIPLPM